MIMSHQEDRSSDSKRHRSRFDREPSPKRSRRDGKPATERPHTNPELDKDHLPSDHKHHRRLQDALPLEAPLGRDAKVETGMVSKESEIKLTKIQKMAIILLIHPKYLDPEDTFRSVEKLLSSADKFDEGAEGDEGGLLGEE